MTIPNLFHSTDTLRDGFAAGLERMLGRDALGTFILVAANASFEPGLWQRLETPLAERFSALRDRYRTLLAEGMPAPDAPDDVAVFLKLALLGMDRVGTTQFRSTGPWELQFNLLRAFRPPRMSTGAVTRIARPFDPDGFHFNKPFMAAEALWSGRLAGRDATVFYNKFPFAEMHGLLVPEPAAGHPQLLTADVHAYAWRVTEQLGARLPGFGLGYNALGANASVNHLHLQSFVREQPLPVEAAHWAHNGGTDPYPVRCRRFTDGQEAWEAVAALHEADTPYNAIYRPGRLYLLPRRFQGGFALPDWTSGLSWYELGGGLITFSPEPFESLEPADVVTLLKAADSVSS